MGRPSRFSCDAKRGRVFRIYRRLPHPLEGRTPAAADPESPAFDVWSQTNKQTKYAKKDAGVLGAGVTLCGMPGLPLQVGFRHGPKEAVFGPNASKGSDHLSEMCKTLAGLEMSMAWSTMTRRADLGPQVHQWAIMRQDPHE